jgi:hypothetical protein
MSLRVKEASKFVGYAFSVFLVHSAEFREIGNKSKASWPMSFGGILVRVLEACCSSLL